MNKSITVARERADRGIMSGNGFPPAHMPQNVTVEWYANDVPDFVEVELDRLYGSLYASLGHFRIHGGDAPTNTYVARKDGRAIVVLLFRQAGRQLMVLNEVICLDMQEINRFAHFGFATFPGAHSIRFKAIHTADARPDFTFQRFNHLEDIVLRLPDTVDAYFSSLGKNTRRNIRRYHRKLTEAFPNFRFSVLHAEQVDEQTARDIIQLNHARMAEKSKLSALDEHSTQQIVRQSQQCGLTGVVTIDGRVCAGAISFRSGANYFLSVIAHDQPYDDYWLGVLCCYLTICECIARGGREFHFLWGEYEYKYTLQGVKRELDNLMLYRSPVHMVLQAGVALQMLRLGLLRRVHQWLHGQARANRPVIRVLRKWLIRWRSWRLGRRAEQQRRVTQSRTDDAAIARHD